MFTTDDIKDFNDIVSDEVSTLGECTQRTVTRDNSIEISLDRGSRHLGLIEMVATRDYEQPDAPCIAVIINAYRYIDRHDTYTIVKNKINEKNLE